MPYLLLLKALGILYTPLTTTILQVNPRPIIPPSSLAHHHEAIPYLRSLALGPIRDLPHHTYSHMDPTAKYKHEANQKKHFRFTSLIPIQPYPNPAERSQPSRSISTHTKTSTGQLSPGLSSIPRVAAPKPTHAKPSPAPTLPAARPDQMYNPHSPSLPPLSEPGLRSRKPAKNK